MKNEGNLCNIQYRLNYLNQSKSKNKRKMHNMKNIYKTIAKYCIKV